MKALVTGVSGFLGGRLAHGLAGQGWRVVGLVRDEARWLDRPVGSEARRGDVTDPESLASAAEGCDLIVHAAALVKMWVPDSRQFDRVNVEGLHHVARVASQRGVPLVYVSSFIALGPTDGRVFDEDTPRDGFEFHNDYERTKWLADRLADHLVERGLPLIRIYPGVVYGPGALTDGNHVVRTLLQHADGELPGMLGDGTPRQCLAYVEDVVCGFLAAVERGKPGDRFILGGGNHSAIELFQAFESAAGIAPPKRTIPIAVARWVGRLQRLRAEWTGREPELTDEVVGIYAHEWAYSSARAERDLDYRITPLAEGVRATVDWLRDQGRLGG